MHPQILAIDDSPADRLLICEAFQAAGYPCGLKIVPSLPEATALLETVDFDLVICDMGGDPSECIAFIRDIRAHGRFRELPVVVLSGSANINVAYEAGANAFIRKAADLDEFFANIKALLHFWFIVAELPVKHGRYSSIYST